MERTQGKHTIYAVIPIWNHDFLYWNSKVCWTNISYDTLKWKNKKFCTIFRVHRSNCFKRRASNSEIWRQLVAMRGFWCHFSSRKAIRDFLSLEQPNYLMRKSWNSIVSELFACRSTLAHVSLSIVFEYVIFCVYLYSICFVTIWNVSKYSFFSLSFWFAADFFWSKRQFFLGN